MHLFHEISALLTEQSNANTENIDLAPLDEILLLINNEDAKVASAVRDVIPSIQRAVESTVRAFRAGGRLYYVGAGTSGRLGVVDASECPPTFGVSPDMVQGIIAGGSAAMFKSQEGAEDSVEAGAAVLEEHDVRPLDVVCGIAASGRTPFVRGALAEARLRGCATILVTTNSVENINKLGIVVDCLIAPQVGPEVIAGSTRMKSGTAQKLILNMLTTSAMICLGKTYGNIMVDLQLTNAKLVERARKIVMTICDVEYQQASHILDQAKGHVKTALVMQLLGQTLEQAEDSLRMAQGHVRVAVAPRFSSNDEPGS